MAIDMFLKLDGVDGESVDSAHKDEIDILAWSWGVSQSGTMHQARGGGGGKANFQDISITKFMDRASPQLIEHCSTGKHIPDAKLTLRKAGGEPLEYLVIELKNVLVAAVSVGGSQGEERLTENVVLNFAQFKYVYQPQSEAGGKEGGTVEFGWNIAENVSA